MLLDTSGLLCTFDADEFRLLEARRLYDEAPIRITHNYVLAEFVALTNARRLPRRESLDFATALIADAEVEVRWVANFNCLLST